MVVIVVMGVVMGKVVVIVMLVVFGNAASASVIMIRVIDNRELITISDSVCCGCCSVSGCCGDRWFIS